MKKADNEQLSILIVDDERSFRETVRAHTRKLGHMTDEAEDGIIALDMLRKKKYDVGIVDIRMPGIDAPNLCLQLDTASR